MPIWSNEGHPPGPLNYIQIEDLVAFIRAPSTETYTKRDPELFEPRHIRHRRSRDVHGLGRPGVQASVPPRTRVLADRVRDAVRIAHRVQGHTFGRRAVEVARGLRRRQRDRDQLTASGIKYDPTALTAQADGRS
jgi:hypothetical protein